jgi:8-oxo-dGTP pyrophosphatase MutT (NUDIX family)
MDKIIKSALVCMKDKKLLVVHKKTINEYISPGGKNEEGEEDLECLKREINEELGCLPINLEFWKTFFDKTQDNKELELRAYFGDLKGEIKINPKDNIDGFLWIERDYDKKIKLANIIKRDIIPLLIKGELL